MRTNFTEAQLQAVTTIDRHVSVSAGAGSGKTRVLVERFLYILERYGLEGAGRKAEFSARNILAITFTRKAATEMKLRIRKEMNERLEHSSAEQAQFWRQQLELLEGAQIGTIHSLCKRILRDNPVEAQLDPDFTVLEDSRQPQFEAEELQRFLRRRLAEGDSQLQLLVQLYGADKVKTQLKTLLPLLPELCGEKNLQSPYIEAVERQLPQLQARLYATLSELAERREELTGAKTKGREQLNALAEQLPELQLLPLEQWDSVVDMPSASGKIKELVNEYKNDMKLVKPLVACRTALPLLDAWQAVLRELQSQLEHSKQQQELLSFADLELQAIKLLREQAEVRRKYQERYPFIMVDEFQDTNELQLQLVHLLCGDNESSLQAVPGKNLFIVGDPKQSIYRFRGADVSVFAAAQQEIAAAGGVNISMYDNFRSTDRVLTACNEVFSHLMSADVEREVYFESLQPHRETEELPQLLLVEYPKDSPLPKRAYEAQIVAQRLKELHAADRDYSEMAILLRAMTHCPTLTAALTAAGVPFTVVDGKGFYERQEVLDLLNLLAVLSNQYSSLELAGVLRSPYFGLTDATLTTLFLNQQGLKLWQALQQQAAELQDEQQRQLAMRAAQKLARLRTVASLQALPQLWECLWQELQVDAVLAGQEYGASKLANAKKLRQLSESYCAEKQASLSAWLQQVQELRRLEVRETAANVSAGDAVTIMTIHKSKGLEFPVVVLPMLDSKIPGDNAEIKYQQGLGLGIKSLVNGELQPTVVLQQLKEQAKYQQAEESKRQLYVAMTRARDLLLMSGVVKPVAAEKQAKQDSESEACWIEQLQSIFTDDSLVQRELITALPAPGDEQVAQQPQPLTPELVERIAPLPTAAGNGRRYFTASALQNYLHCPRSYFYQQLAQLPEVEPETLLIGESGELPAYITGLVVHRTLELYRGDLQAALSKALQEQSLTEAPAAEQLLANYLASDLYRSLPRRQERELSFLLPLPEQGLFVDGVIDYLGYDEQGGLIIVDYKTGTPPQPGELKLGYAYQLALYKKAAEQLLKQPVHRAELHFLQDLSVWQLPADDSHLEQALALCLELSHRNSEEGFACHCGAGCAYCGYAYLCPQK